MFIVSLYWYINKIKTKLGLVHEREPYLIGITNKIMDECYNELVKINYQWDYFAWEDIGEGVSARKLYDNRQVHVRVFEDGEVRVHDEYNYEYEALKHYNGESLKEPDTNNIEKIIHALNITDLKS